MNIFDFSRSSLCFVCRYASQMARSPLFIIFYLLLIGLGSLGFYASRMARSPERLIPFGNQEKICLAKAQSNLSGLGGFARHPCAHACCTLHRAAMFLLLIFVAMRAGWHAVLFLRTSAFVSENTRSRFKSNYVKSLPQTQTNRTVSKAVSIFQHAI